jgi:hypothetical protein
MGGGETPNIKQTKGLLNRANHPLGAASQGFSTRAVHQVTAITRRLAEIAPHPFCFSRLFCAYFFGEGEGGKSRQHSLRCTTRLFIPRSGSKTVENRRKMVGAIGFEPMTSTV